MKAFERLIDYSTFPTGSDENSEICPSTIGQMKFADHLVASYTSLGWIMLRLIKMATYMLIFLQTAQLLAGKKSVLLRIWIQLTALNSIM